MIMRSRVRAVGSRTALGAAALTAKVGLLAVLASVPAPGDGPVAQVRNSSDYPFVQGAPGASDTARPGDRPGAFRRDRDEECAATSRRTGENETRVRADCR